MNNLKRSITFFWHPHSEPPVYVPGGDNRLILCMNMERMPFHALKGICVTYDELNPDGSLNSCADMGHSDKWLKKHAIQWEHLYKNTWWAYVRDIIPVEEVKMKQNI